MSYTTLILMLNKKMNFHETPRCLRQIWQTAYAVYEAINVLKTE